MAVSSSVRQGRAGRHACAGGEPLFVGLERHADPVVEDPEITVATSHHRFGHHRLHLLRHHAHIGALAAVVGEAIEAEAVVEMAQQHDVVLEVDVGPTSAATAAAEAATAAAPPKATTATAAAEAAAAPAGAHAAAAGELPSTAAAEALMPARGRRALRAAGRHVHGRRACCAAAATASASLRAAAATGRISGTGAITTTRTIAAAITRTGAITGAIAGTGTVPTAIAGTGTAATAVAGTDTVATAITTAIATAIAGTVATAITTAIASTVATAVPITAIGSGDTITARAITAARAVPAGIEHALTVLAAEVLARAAARLDVVAGVLLTHGIVVVLHAMPVRRIVLPRVADIGDIADIDVVDGAIDGDVVVAPVDARAPVAPAPRPAAERIAGAECESGGDDAGRDVSGSRPVVGRIGRIGPRAVDD